MIIARTCFNPHRQRCDLSGGAGIVYDDTESLRVPESSPTEILIRIGINMTYGKLMDVSLDGTV